MVDKTNFGRKTGRYHSFMDDKEEFRTEQIVTQLGLTETTAKRYLRQLTEFGYLEAHGGNRNKSYTKRK